MRLGIWTPLPHTIRSEPRMDAAAAESRTRGAGGRPDKAFQYAVDVLRTAEDAGFETTLIAERFNGPDLEAWMLTSALAVETRSIELIVAVHPGIFHPQVVAKMAVTLDQISGGRAAVNLINGWWRQEFDLYSNGAWLDRNDQRYERMEEFMTVLTELWTKDTPRFQGRFYRVEDGSLPSTAVRRPYPPLYCSSLSPIGRDAAARLGDYWFPTQIERDDGYTDFDWTIARVAEEMADMDARCASYGRAMRHGVSGHVIATRTREEALARARDIHAYGDLGMMNAVVSKSMNTGLVGTYEDVAQRLLRYADIGVEFTLLHFHPMLEGLESFAEHVVPLLHAEGLRPPSGHLTGTA